MQVRNKKPGAATDVKLVDRDATRANPVKKSADRKTHEFLELKEKLRQTEMLLNISRAVAAMETVDEVLETLVVLTTKETGAERGTLFLNDVQTGELYSRVAQGAFKRKIRLLKGISQNDHFRAPSV